VMGGVGMGQKEMATTAAGKNRDHDLRPESRWHSSQTLTSALCPLSSRRLKSRCHNRGSKGGGDAGARPPNARAGTAVAAVRPETTSGGTIARRCISARPPKWTGGLNRERDAVKRRRGPGSPFCLVEQGYGGGCHITHGLGGRSIYWFRARPSSPLAPSTVRRKDSPLCWF
jgi:hypothetical protein